MKLSAAQTRNAEIIKLHGDNLDILAEEQMASESTKELINKLSGSSKIYTDGYTLISESEYMRAFHDYARNNHTGLDVISQGVYELLCNYYLSKLYNAIDLRRAETLEALDYFN